MTYQQITDEILGADKVQSLDFVEQLPKNQSATVDTFDFHLLVGDADEVINMTVTVYVDNLGANNESAFYKTGHKEKIITPPKSDFQQAVETAIQSQLDNGNFLEVSNLETNEKSQTVKFFVVLPIDQNTVEEAWKFAKWDEGNNTWDLKDLNKV